MKGANLFGLWQARHAIRQRGARDPRRGQLRRREPARARGRERRGAAGHGLHRRPGKLLRRYAVDLTLLFDGDAAGRKAARAAEEPCDEAGLDAEGRACCRTKTDPDEFVRSQGRRDALRHVARAGAGAPRVPDRRRARRVVQRRRPPRAGDARRAGRGAHRPAEGPGRCAAMLKAYADRARRPARHGTLRARRLRRPRAQGRRGGPGGPRRLRARARRGAGEAAAPGQEDRKAIVGRDPRFPRASGRFRGPGRSRASRGDSARIVAAIAQCMRVTARGEKVAGQHRIPCANARRDPSLRVRALGGPDARDDRRSARRP